MNNTARFRLMVTAVALAAFSMVTAHAADKKVAVMWEGKASMAKRVLMGFSAKMKQIAPNVEVVSKIDLPDMAQAEKIFRDFEASVNGIVFLRSSGAEFLAKADPKLPCFVGGCNNPQFLGAVKNLEAPEGKITGVTYFIPYEKRFAAIKSVFPHTKRVALLAQKGHPGTPIDQEGTKAECQKLGIAYNEVIASDAKELLSGAEQIAGRVDLFIISSTRLAMDNTTGLVGISNKTKLPIFSYADGRAELGATAELAADDEKLGAMLAESVTDVVVKGKPITQVPVKMDPDPKLIINESQVKALGLQIPPDALAKAKKVQ